MRRHGFFQHLDVNVNRDRDQTSNGTNHHLELTAKCTPRHSDRCQAARTKNCTCQCGGHNHGARMRDREAGQAFPMTDLKTFDGYETRECKPRVTGANLVIDLYRDEHGNGLANLAQRWVKHSPTGFEWGYGGSGPADLALNILGLLLDGPTATRLYKAFKWEVITRLPHGGCTFHLSEVEDWIKNKWLHTQPGTYAAQHAKPPLPFRLVMTREPARPPAVG